MGTSSSKWWVLRRNLKSAVKKINNMLIRRWRRITNSVVSGTHKRHWWWRSRASLGRQHRIAEADWNQCNSESGGALKRAKMVTFHSDVIGHNNLYEYDCEEDDIDGRAENFIVNFRRRLQMERQDSLELRYS
ncbi:hypothetical protein NL676_033029 [Syzygium grande]|nr:hypothetical protein NL676_033029 [Syzygium grande]